jgi:hypothetical protein
MWHVEYLWSPCVFNFATWFNIGYVQRTVSKLRKQHEIVGTSQQRAVQ